MAEVRGKQFSRRKARRVHKFAEQGRRYKSKGRLLATSLGGRNGVFSQPSMSKNQTYVPRLSSAGHFIRFVQRKWERMVRDIANCNDSCSKTLWTITVMGYGDEVYRWPWYRQLKIRITLSRVPRSSRHPTFNTNSHKTYPSSRPRLINPAAHLVHTQKLNRDGLPLQRFLGKLASQTRQRSAGRGWVKEGYVCVCLKRVLM